MSKRKFNLICVSHPDDETIFFGGLIQRRRKHPWLVVCVTDGNADGNGAQRRRQFHKACRDLGVEKTLWLGFPDRYDLRLPVSDLIGNLRELPDPHEIFTHGIIGEYGHPHHQDVSYCVHEAFAGHSRLYSVAYNAFPELLVQLSPPEYEAKSKILSKTYGSETARFLNLLPSTYAEGFLRYEASEVRAIYEYLARNRPLQTKSLRAHKWLAAFLKQNANLKRPF